MSENAAWRALVAADPALGHVHPRDDEALLERIRATERIPTSRVDAPQPQRRRKSRTLAMGGAAIAILVLASLAFAGSRLDVHIFSNSNQPDTSPIQTSALLDVWQHGLPSSPRRYDHHLPIDVARMRVLASVDSSAGEIRDYVAPIADTPANPPELQGGTCFALVIGASVQSGDCWPAPSRWTPSYGAFPPLTGASPIGDVLLYQGYLPAGASGVAIRASDGRLVQAASLNGYWVIFLPKDDAPTGPTAHLVGQDASGATVWSRDIANG